jgi:hypothetical protein
VKGILADVHMGGYVESLVREMQSEYWVELWNVTGLSLYHFDDVGLTPTSTDREIWLRCQAELLILVTNNRNRDSDDSLEAVIAELNTPDSLPAFTIGSIRRLRRSRDYAARVVEKMYEHILDIDRVRGAGRLFLP